MAEEKQLAVRYTAQDNKKHEPRATPNTRYTDRLKQTQNCTMYHVLFWAQLYQLLQGLFVLTTYFNI